MTILLSTQYLEEADQLADTIIVLDHGRIVAQGSADALKSRLGAEVVRLEFAERADFDRALGCLDGSRADGRLHTIEVATDGTAANVHAILGRLVVVGVSTPKVSVHRPSLDDVFLSLTGPGSPDPRSKEVA